MVEPSGRQTCLDMGKDKKAHDGMDTIVRPKVYQSYKLANP